MKTLLKVRDLHVTFNSHLQRVHAVRGLSFDVYEGETLGIVGESGSGKSAAVKSLVRLLPERLTHIRGNAYMKERDLIAMTEQELQRIRGKEIGMIFQDPMTSLNPTKKIGAQIAEGYLHHHPRASLKEAAKRSLELLQWVGISNPEVRLTEYPHTLSGGMRQRVMIALALASSPQLLLADEPTTALDVTIQAQILNLLKTVQEQLKMTIVLITHDLSVVAAMCDRVLVMYAGQIVESGTVYEVFNTPRHPYTQRLMQSLPRLDHPKDRPLIPIEGSPPDLSSTFVGCAFCPRCDSALDICHLQEPPLFNERSKCWLHHND